MGEKMLLQKTASDGSLVTSSNAAYDGGAQMDHWTCVCPGITQKALIWYSEVLCHIQHWVAQWKQLGNSFRDGMVDFHVHQHDLGLLCL